MAFAVLTRAYSCSISHIGLIGLEIIIIARKADLPSFPAPNCLVDIALHVKVQR